ncbi:MAG: anthranilate synthase component I family protein [Myxococcales bacterium]|nr:anthranilate synthase component I family protein [Myxococcales bacterium]
MIARIALAGLAPIDAARRLAGLPGRFLLASGSDADGRGRWSFAGAMPERVLSWRVGESGDPFAELEALADGPVDPDGGPLPRAVGFLGYGLGRVVERLPARARDDLGLPELWLARYGAVFRHDHVTGESVVLGEDAAAVATLAARLAAPPSTTATTATAPAPRLGPLLADEDAAVHLAAVARALEYIRAGDVYQVNLARRLSAVVIEHGDPLALFERLAGVPYGALLECGDGPDRFAVVSASPELFLARAAGAIRVETRPIKGTRRRGANPEEDRALAAELAADPKERAEHLMIVDLERNDLGRVARIGSVRVDGFARALPLPGVHHLVSTVSADVVPGAGHAQLLRATFPGGSITGCPKVRAMELIDELEPVARGPYTGAIGWLGGGGSLHLSVAIRTAVLTQGALHLHVGGGVVADSRPERELEETEEKALAWRAALA